MAKTGQDAEVYQNNYWILRFTVVDEDAVGEPPRNITSDRIFWSMTRVTQSGTPLVNDPIFDFDSTDDPSIVVKTTPASGLVEVRILASLNADVDPRSYWHELEVVDVSGNPVVSATGTLTVLHNVVNA